jgi:hypothetical protein
MIGPQSPDRCSARVDFALLGEAWLWSRGGTPWDAYLPKDERPASKRARTYQRCTYVHSGSLIGR